MPTKTNVILVILAVAAILLMQSVFIVREGQQVMVLQFGDPVAQYTDPGLKFKIPFIQQDRAFEKRTLDLDPSPEEVILSDQKRIVVDVFSRYRITNMLEFHRTVGTEAMASSRLNNIINSTTRSVLGTATMAALLSEKRAGLMESVRSQVNTAVAYMGIEIVDVRIGRADLPEQTSQAIFSRMRTEREREAAEFRAQGQELAQEIRSKADRERTVLLAEAEKKSQTLRGEGDKGAIEIYAKAYNQDPEFYGFYRSLEAYRQGLADGNTTLVLSPDNEFFRYFNRAR
jgi:membrane protease subunit HflC